MCFNPMGSSSGQLLEHIKKVYIQYCTVEVRSHFLQVYLPFHLALIHSIIYKYNQVTVNCQFHSLVFSLEGWAWQEPEPSHVTGMALVHCILHKFLGVVCHCFPLPLDIPTLATRCLCLQQCERSQQRKVELWARKMSSSNFA